MKIHKIYPQRFAANSYFVTCDEKNAVCIDPAQPRILDEAKKRELQVKYVLLTHGHFDHIGGVSALQKAGAQVGCLQEEKELVLGKNNMGEAFGERIAPFTVDFTFSDGEELSLCGINFRVLATAGHTAGSCCFLCENNLFTGDTLFQGSVGRTDLPTGNARELFKSLKKLAELDGSYNIYAGHGEDSTLEYERKCNGYLKV